MWVTSGSYVGHIRIVLWVSGSNGSTGATHCQPWYNEPCMHAAVAARVSYVIAGYYVVATANGTGQSFIIQG